MALCSICKTRHAIIFTSRFEAGKRIDEGFCLKCAYESGIAGVSDMFKATGINGDNIDEMSERIEDMIGNNDVNADPSEFLRSLASGEFGNGFEDDDDGYEFDEDSTPINVADADESKSGDEEEERKQGFLGGMFGRRPGSMAGKDDEKKGENGKKLKNRSRLKYLNEFGTNLTQRAQEGKIDRIIGRDTEIERCIQILNRRSKNNPVLIGAPGVGKTAVAQGLAVKIVEGTVPEKLLNMQVWQLDLPAMVAGTQFRGQFESRIKGVINEAIKAENIILVIDELHTIVGAGDAEGSTNAANILKPALARGELRILGSTTTAEYKKIEKDSALERRFQKVMLDEPSIEDSIEILKGIKDYYEKHHNVTYSDEVIEFAVKSSKRYITDRFLPDKAIDLIDEAGSAANLKNVKLVKLANTKKALAEAQDEHQKQLDSMENSSPEEREADYEKAAELKAKVDRLEAELNALESEVSPDPIQIEDIARVVEMWTGIPLKSISESETDKLLHLEERLHQRVVGQEQAVHAVAEAVRRTRAGFTKKHKPTSFIFVGPTGVGKTELVKALAEVMFDTEEALIRIDMSEYMEPHSVSKLIGSPPGYVGFDDAGQLTEQVRRKPYSVILFDEVEKAHPDVFNLLLQMLDDGVLTDSHGLHVNFENCIIIMTSNAGSSAKASTIGFFSGTHEALEQHVQTALKETFRPEFLNRVDETIIFKELTPDEIRKIADIMMKDVYQSLADKGIKGTMTKSAGDRLAEVGYDEKYGARPLRKAIRSNIEDALADMFLKGELKDVSELKIGYRSGKFVFDTVKAKA
ncbi:MAG: ATP-dependent Clp protease ATP-binding subunit [Clostridiales bacterium]|nr:ATP-dependent Clp protease ATP-binding subunit [Clostridiales bacterium]